MERMGIGDQLYGAKFGILGFVNRRDDRQRLIIRLAAVIPAAKVFTHREPSKCKLEYIIPILMDYLSYQAIASQKSYRIIPSTFFRNDKPIEEFEHNVIFIYVSQMRMRIFREGLAGA